MTLSPSKKTSGVATAMNRRLGFAAALFLLMGGHCLFRGGCHHAKDELLTEPEDFSDERLFAVLRLHEREALTSSTAHLHDAVRPFWHAYRARHNIAESSNDDDDDRLLRVELECTLPPPPRAFCWESCCCRCCI